MGWQDLLKDYFRFSRKERIGVIAVVSVIILILSLPALVGITHSKEGGVYDTAWIAELRRLEDTTAGKQENRGVYSPGNYDQAGRSQRYNNIDRRKSVSELFYFDPNTATATTWERLGLRPKTISTILHFVTKGGKFRTPDDLKKIYGLFPDEFDRLAPYVQIAPVLPSSFSRDSSRAFSSGIRPKNTLVDINIADTSAWIALPGIGSKLANRIIQFREKLGGFHTVAQVSETYGLADSIFQKIRQFLTLQTTGVKKLNINSASVDELKSHPYIRYTIANAIVAYRNQHGAFGSLEELNKLMQVTPEIYLKIVSYLTL